MTSRREFMQQAKMIAPLQDVTRIVHRNYTEVKSNPPKWETPQVPTPDPEKCARTVCTRKHANCVSTVDGRLYCRSCAHKINQYNAGLITLPTIDPDK